MDDTLSDQLIESCEDLCHVVDCVLLTECFFVFEESAQVSLVAELLYDVVIIACFDNIFEADYVFGFDFVEDSYLEAKCLAHVLVHVY